MADNDALISDSPSWLPVKQAQVAGNLYAAFHIANGNLASVDVMAKLFSNIFDAGQRTGEGGKGRGEVPKQYPFPGLRGLQTLIQDFQPDVPKCKMPAEGKYYPGQDAVESINDFLIDYHDKVTKPGLTHAQLVEVYHIVFAQEDVRLLAPFEIAPDGGSLTRAW